MKSIKVAFFFLICVFTLDAGAASNSIVLTAPTSVSELDQAVETKLKEAEKVPSTAVATEKADEKSSSATEAAKSDKLPSVAKSTAESENLPVFEKKEAVKKNTPDLANRILVTIGVCGVLLGGLIIFGRRWINFQKSKAKETQIKVLTQHFLGPKKSLAIIRVAGETMLIGVTEHNINMIKSLSIIDDNEVPETVPAQFKNALHEQEILEDSELEIEVPDMHATAERETEQFSIRGIKDFVSDRIRSRRI